MKEKFNSFTVLISKVSRLIHKIKTEEMAGFGLKGSHVSCLYYVYKAGALSAKGLCEIADEDKAVVSRSLVALEKDGYLKCDSSAKKRYNASFSLTEKGQNVAKSLDDKIEAVISRSSAGLTEENRTVFYESLSLICDNLNSICKQYGG